MSKIPMKYRTVTQALHGYPKKHGYDIEWIANEMWNRFGIKLGHSTLERYLNPNDDLKFPADLIEPFCLICDNDFSVLDFIKKAPEKIDITCRSVAGLMKEAGEAVAELSETVKDGRIEPGERQRCIKELLELKELAAGLLARLIK